MSAVLQDFPSAADPLGSSGKSLRDHLGMLRRRRGLILVVFSLIFVVALLVAVALPPVYRSTATILIKEQEIPQEFVRSTVTSYADERIQVISQQVMTRSTMLELVDRYGLYGKARQRETSEEILDRMRRDIKLLPISAEVTDRRTGSPVKATIAFSLSYDSQNPASAQKIASELSTLYLNENVKQRQQRAAETTSFLDEELARVSQRISEAEKKLAAFKARNQGRTPDLSLSNQVNSERVNTDLQRVDRDIAFMAERVASMQMQLADTKPNLPIGGEGGALDPEDKLRAMQLQLSTATGSFSEDHPDVKRLRREIAVLQAETGVVEVPTDREARRLQLEEQLANLRRTYADDHPDVAKVKRSLAALEAPAASAPERRVRKPDNPVYVTLKTQIETTQSQVQSMRIERDEMRAKQQLFDMRVSQTPEVEREYLELVRELDGSRARFRDLRDKQMQAEVAEQLERARKAERFTLIEPPIYPEKPYRPNRGVILMMGVVLALVAGLGAAALREAIDQTVHHPRDLMRVLQVPVLAVWPTLADPVLALRRKRARRIVAAGVLLLILVLAGGLHAFYMPLDVAWYALLRRLTF